LAPWRGHPINGNNTQGTKLIAIQAMSRDNLKAFFIQLLLEVFLPFPDAESVAFWWQRYKTFFLSYRCSRQIS